MSAFRSFISVSVAAPTLISATPPAILARRSCNFSRSYSLVVASISARICAARPLIASFVPPPLTIVVFSAPTMTFFALPRSVICTASRAIPRSLKIASPPVRTAISPIIAFRRSPYPGALTATVCTMPRSLFTTRVARASPSTSSAIMTSGLPALLMASRRGTRFFALEIFSSKTKI